MLTAMKLHFLRHNMAPSRTSDVTPLMRHRFVYS